MTNNAVTRTTEYFQDREFHVSIREWHPGMFTLVEVRTAGACTGTDFEHYATFVDAHAEGVRVAREMIVAQ